MTKPNLAERILADAIKRHREAERVLRPINRAYELAFPEAWSGRKVWVRCDGEGG